MVSIEVPQSENPVTVKVIDNGARITGPMSFFLDPPILDDFQSKHELFSPAFVFLIEHQQSHRRVVFDLGIRKNLDDNPPAVLSYHKHFKIQTGEEVFDVLQDGGVDLESIEAVIWSHHHMDHTGNRSGFPPTTKLVVGPGFSETLFPAYPENTQAMVGQRDLDGRTVHQLDFERESAGLTIGGFRAIDYFKDGSFYLLEAPGHSIDHVMTLARTSLSPSRFLRLGADIGHHPSQWRPNKHTPLPKELDPSFFGPESKFNLRFNVCCGDHFASNGVNNKPFTRVKAGHPYDVDEAQRAVDKMALFDADENIMVIAAHDFTLLPILDYFPREANGWYEAGWKNKGQWEFLKELVGIVEGKAES
ncbi:putative metallo-beta-lactamase superfamily protein [Fusarium austroafricanum]|uniref:Putative metallo-beta-lactamase superfamily protein n=1 Tax=Fusarium austroafricanum TaxID=2364996 RepID=A0A8H4NUN8_9HYPO|nr:putative metallo-beta-lactamase superfamily protein [Fusarium austroafricanum]